MAQYANRFISNPPASLSKNFAAATAGSQVKTGPGVLVSLNVNTGDDGSSVTLYDGTSTAGKKLGAFPTAAANGLAQVPLNFAFTTGLFAVVAGGDPDVTVGYR